MQVDNPGQILYMSAGESMGRGNSTMCPRKEYIIASNITNT
jgi:hypothetical protein